MPKQSIIEILEKLNKSNPLRYTTNGSKNKKKLKFAAFWPHGLDP